jgi:C4-dicarboxylate-specific signal transduction histidine kinase
MSGRLADARSAMVPQELCALLDALPIPALLVAASGEVLHANPEAAVHTPAGDGAPLFLPGIGECRLLVAPLPPGPQTQRLASLGFMLAGVCHEVSNPLAAISSMVQILQSKRGVSAETTTKGLASIAANIARVLAITKKLGDFSRVTGDAPATHVIDDAVTAAAALLRHSPCGHGVSVEYRGAPGVRVLARPGELQQVVFNVFLNAAQAMQGAGRIEAGARLEGSRVVLSIRDHGPGIPQEHLPRLFDPFFTTKQPGEGTGLGLAISYEIVHELGGSMRAANHPQGGACFEIALPASRAA